MNSAEPAAAVIVERRQERGCLTTQPRVSKDALINSAGINSAEIFCDGHRSSMVPQALMQTSLPMT